VRRDDRVDDDRGRQQQDQDDLPAQSHVAPVPGRAVAHGIAILQRLGADLGVHDVHARAVLKPRVSRPSRRASGRISLSGRRSARALMMTAARMTAPEIAICQNGEICRTGSAVMTMPRNNAPSSVPATDPMPPPIDTPPITQAAITVSS